MECLTLQSTIKLMVAVMTIIGLRKLRSLRRKSSICKLRTKILISN